MIPYTKDEDYQLFRRQPSQNFRFPEIPAWLAAFKPPTIAPGPALCQVPPMIDRLTYTHAGNPPGFDRMAAVRDDEAWISARLHGRTSRVVPVWRGMNLVLDGEGGDGGDRQPCAVMLTGDHARGLLQIAGEVAFLGVTGGGEPGIAGGGATVAADGTAYFACDVSAHDLPALAPLIGRGDFIDLRQVGVAMGRAEAALLAHARGILYWHTRHRYCGVCGGLTDSRSAGHMRLCSSPDCAQEHHPRIDPAVIMLVTRPGPEGGACLLGRHPRLPGGMYSTLAGFVEPGETLEQAVAREVREETGITVSEIAYQGSQPWPFPSSLMLGFRAEARTVQIDIDGLELEDARWFTRGQVRDFGAKGLRLPRADSIAHKLIDAWLKEI